MKKILVGMMLWMTTVGASELVTEDIVNFGAQCVVSNRIANCSFTNNNTHEIDCRGFVRGVQRNGVMMIQPFRVIIPSNGAGYAQLNALVNHQLLQATASGTCMGVK